MPDNPFEHKAKQKLDELSFTPSDAVWQKVEAQIKKDKNRRRLLIWLPLFCLLLGAGGWYFITGKPKPVQENQVTAIHYKDKNKLAASAIQSAPLKAAASAVTEKGKTATGAERNNEVASVLSGNKKTAVNQQQTEITGSPFSTEQKEAAHTARLPAQRQMTGAYSENTERRAAADTTDSASGNTDNHTPDTALSSSIPVNTNDNRRDPAPADPAAGRKAGSAGQKELAALSPVHQDSLGITAVKKTAAAKKNRMIWGIAAGPGFSSVSEKFVQNGYLYASPPSTAASTIPLGAPSAKGAFAYFAGLTVKKPLNKTLSVFTGLRYTYSGIKISRGNPMNLPLTIYGSNNYISNYYSAAAPGNFNYTSHYHFLEIPLGIEKQLGQQSRLSVNAGISLARLLATNALQFDPQSRIYYRDDSYFNKTQWNILGGLQYSLLEKRKYTLRVGPQVQYGLSSLLNKKSLYSEHLFFGGIQLMLLSNRK